MDRRRPCVGCWSCRRRSPRLEMGDGISTSDGREYERETGEAHLSFRRVMHLACRLDHWVHQGWTNERVARECEVLHGSPGRPRDRHRRKVLYGVSTSSVSMYIFLARRVRTCSIECHNAISPVPPLLQFLRHFPVHHPCAIAMRRNARKG